MSSFLLKVISQEKELLKKAVNSVTVPTSTGIITILAKHIPLFSQVIQGELIYRVNGHETSLVVTNGFVDVGYDGVVSVLVDSAVLARDISIKKAEAAVKAAQESVKKSAEERELMLAEASLRLAMLELKVAQKTKRSTTI